MGSGKGNTCPACGEFKFHDEGAIHKCSNCSAVGWWGAPGSPGGGRGAKCRVCNGNTLKEVYADHNFEISFCSTCNVTFVKAA